MKNEENMIQCKIFNKKGDILVDKEIPFKKFRLMKELELIVKDGVDESEVDIEETIEFLNANNESLRIKSILVVDDESILRDLYKAQIGRFCHYVQVYESATDALKEFRSNPLKYDFILTDNIMPEMKGDELADKVKEVKSDLPIYIITGDADSVSEESFSNSVSGIIKKPINGEQLKSFIGQGKIDLFNRNTLTLYDADSKRIA